MADKSNDLRAEVTTTDARARERQRVAKIAAYTRWAREPDRSAATAPARRASLARFEAEVDPEGLLSPRERGLRAEAARRAHFIRMSHRSAQVRRRKANGGGVPPSAA